MQIGHFLSLCDDTGLLQHALHCVPDRSHGYCTDDNARALLVACALGKPGEQRLPEPLTSRFAAFVQHAWNPDTKRFRNFMSFDRRWLEDLGSEDSHGRALWALGECARSDRSPSRRRWAASLFAAGAAGRGELSLAARVELHAARVGRLLRRGGGGLGREAPAASCSPTGWSPSWRRSRTEDWEWFEEGLAYDNARLPQALIVTGVLDRNARIRERRSAVPALAHDAADDAGGPLQARRLAELRRRADAAFALRPAAPGSRRSGLGLPRGMARRRRSRVESPRRSGRSHGSSAATICLCRWSIWKQAAAATDCIPIGSTRIGVGSPSCPTS